MRFVKVCDSCGYEGKFPLAAMYSEHFISQCTRCKKWTMHHVEKRNDKEEK